MNLRISVSERNGTALRVVDITLPAAETADAVLGHEEPDLVAGDGREAVEALGEISQALQCPNTLEDMLYVIDRLQAGTAAAITPRYVKLDDAGNPLPIEATSWAAVHDRTSGLVWSAENVGGKRLTHDKAKAACEKLTLAGASDWQLPTRTQLLTLVDDTRHEPAIDTDFFPKTESAWYWTSTPCAWRPGSAAWCVYFHGGGVDFLGLGRGFECFVRAVRVASPASSQ